MPQISAGTKAWISMAFTAFLGGVIGFVAPYMSGVALPTDGSKWRSIAIGAGFAGVVAVYHRFKEPPPVPTSDNKGFGKVETLLAISFTGATAMAGYAACTPATGPADVNATKCILEAAAEAGAQGLDGVAAALYVESKCLVSEIEVVATLKAARAAARMAIPDGGTPPIPPRNPGF